MALSLVSPVTPSGSCAPAHSAWVAFTGGCRGLLILIFTSAKILQREERGGQACFGSSWQKF